MAELDRPGNAPETEETDLPRRAEHCFWPDETRRNAQDLIREIPLFKNVPPHHLRELARFAHQQHFAAGETIIRMGEPGSTMYVISAGQVEVVLEQPDQNIVLATLGPGEFFGELSIFDSEMRSATVVAVEPTEAWTLGRLDIVRILNRSPDMALSLLKSISARLRIMNVRLGDAPPEVQATTPTTSP
jgi:CRP/FNR family cyclic AMP-dependent transcriptional regulator